MERSVHDALCVVKRVLESKSVVPGGGAVETALSIYLENFATSLVSPVHDCTSISWFETGGLAILIKLFFLCFSEFSRAARDRRVCQVAAGHPEAAGSERRARLDRPRRQTARLPQHVSAVEGARRTQVVSPFIIAVRVSRGFLRRIPNVFLVIFRIGLDLHEGKVRDNKAAGVFEPTISKVKSLKFATEAAITILRIDDMIKLEPEKKEGGKSYQEAVRAGEL